MKLKTRIRLFCLCMALVIVLSSAGIMAVYIWTSFKNNIIASANATNRQTILTLDNLLDSMDEASLAPLLDPEVYAILRKKYLPNDKYLIYQDQEMVSKKLYTNVYYRNSSIQSITLVPFNSKIASYKNRTGRSPNTVHLEKQHWYKQIISAPDGLFIMTLEKDEMYPQNKPMLCFARKLVDAEDVPIGIIRVDIPLSEIQYLCSNLLISPETQYALFGSDKEIIYSSFENISTPVSISSEKELISQNGIKYLSVSDKSRDYGFTLQTYIPVSYVRKNAYSTMLLICLAASLLLITAFGLISVFSNRTMEPIQELNECMKEVRQGDLTVRAKTEVGGEFGEVCESFNSMVDNTQKLIDQIYQEEDEKRKAEFAALQAQISPHFLLNTLNTIQWMAYLQGSKSIESALGDLSKILSFTVRNHHDKVTIKIEVEQLGYYINILSRRYPNRFTVRFNVQEEALSCKTLKYLLQPFLENSIFHGLDGLDRDGEIDVTILRQDNEIHYSIRDNGQGMTEEQITTITQAEKTKDLKGMNRIGIQNVIKRIKMEYGPDYGIRIQSNPGEYTQISIRIPAEEESGRMFYGQEETD